MAGLACQRGYSVRHASKGHGEAVYSAYWIAAGALIAVSLLGLQLDQPVAIAVATLVFIGGGLPHGAYDIALLRRSVALGRFGLAVAVGGYVAVVILMAFLWVTVSIVTLALFLAVASVHFGEDWPMLEDPLLRFGAGAAVIAAATIGHPDEVSTVFVAMSDRRAAVITQIITAAAPVALLLTTVGIALAWREGSRHWAVAMTVCLGLLIVLPPIASFALFFVFLHSPRHLARTRTLLGDMSLARWVITGALLSGLTILGWWGLRAIAPSRFAPTIASQAFQLLASVAVPHLLLSRWIEGRLVAAPSSQERTAVP